MVVEPLDPLLVTLRDHGVEVFVVSRIEVEELVARVSKLLVHLPRPGLSPRSRALADAVESRSCRASENVLLHELDEAGWQRLTVPSLGLLLAFFGPEK